MPLFGKINTERIKQLKNPLLCVPYFLFGAGESNPLNEKAIEENINQ
jgi:hypothetical protein